MQTPIQQVAAPDVDISKSAKQESGERQKSHTKHSKQNQVSKRRVATNGGVPFVVDSSSLLEDSLSTADMSKLVELAQRAKQHNPDLIEDADQLPGITPSDNAKPADSASAAESLPASDEKIQKQARLSDSDAKQPKAKRPNSATGTTMPAGDGAPARPRVRTFDTGLSTHKLAAGGAAAATAAMVAAALAGGTASEDTPAVHIAMTTNEAAENGADVKAKGGKLGRKARLRLKRQVWRQKQEQQQQSEAVGTKGTSQPFVSGTKGKGNEKGKLRVSEQPGTGLTAPAKAAQLSARLLKAKQQTSASEQPSQVKKKLSSKQAASAVDASVADALAVDTVTPGAKVTGQEGKAHQKAAQQGSPAAEATVAADQKRLAHKKSKGGLLDQMRSKLSGGRFRMLNEQLYTAPGQEAFETMQGDPALFEQYHEVSHCSGLACTMCSC